jgi:antibiotic biosynthesis monooxygenase (ABM) superfamily enzyme
MSKILFTISYEINPEKREEYLQLAQEIKQHFVGTKGKNYTIYEQKGKKNSFTEIFLCNSMEEYETLEDDQDETTEELVNRLEGFLVNGKMKYTTLIEL